MDVLADPSRPWTALNVGPAHAFFLSSPPGLPAALVKATRPPVDPLPASLTQGSPARLPDFRVSKTTHENAEYSHHLCTVPGLPAPEYNLEVIAPASEKQIRRAAPDEGSAMVRETPALYAAAVEPLLASAAAASLAWVYNCVSLSSESERVLLNSGAASDGFILNVDTKWKKHCDCRLPREEWKDHEDTDLEGLYCLAIVKERGIKSIRDLTATHLPLLRSILSAGPAAIQDTYGVKPDQLRVFLHYVPQFYHLHVHFTSLATDFGVQCERAHLLNDVVQNLEMDPDYYKKRTIEYKLPVNDKIYERIQEYRASNPSTS
ncbi:hypothetical protein TeGR_g15042 [Tetraparma gracilis]|uniref:Scavenger mRNA decapping enzyme n=1 Tax=Tetraparma gracilis TaxID=2962635 RepID=A0ABQ6MPH6_9STRA|nr:hypothetical protein TeGR_g15042 [Tetraparma gracilis]